MTQNLTHRLAVIAYVLCGNEFLLLKRLNPPKIWGPPGGRLKVDENPNEGVLREIKEETGLAIKVLGPVDIWYGQYDNGTLVSIDYIATTQQKTVILSDEHEDFRWASIEDLRNLNPPLAENPPAFLLKDFEKAWETYLTWISP